MRLRNLLLGTAVALGSVGAAGAAAAAPSGWYINLAAGANFLEDGSVDYKSFGVVTSPYEYSWETGYAVVGAVGYDFGDHWRVEFELGYRDNDGDRYVGSPFNTGTTSAELWELSQMVNVLYDIPVTDRFDVAVGAGIGGNLVHWAWQDSAAETDDYVLAGQLIAQAAYRLADRWQVYLDYRYMINDDPEFDDPTDFEESWEIEKTEHTVMVGFRFDLQRDGAAPPPKAEAPPPAKGPKQFIVFFGFNKSNLTPEAARVVADAAAAAKEYGTASIVVVGHTDTVGSPRYNNALSMRRSQSVKDGLQSNGIPSNAISTAGKGESELMVQTGDGIKEPQNRRATIDLAD